jgi:acetyltransferase-like isoleucine patch superfamily enzyme
MPNVTIGENSVIAAYSFVNKDVPDNEIWAGIPASFKSKVHK